MGLTNEELVAKATIVASDLASGGKLNDAQSNRFIDYVFDESVLPSFARIVRFRNENLDIDKLGIGRRAAVPKNEAVDPAVRRGVSTSKVTLTPKEIMVPTEIGDNFKDHNIEGESVVQSVLRLFARQLNNDTELMYIHGNTGGLLQTEDELFDNGNSSLVREDSLLKLFDGILLQADAANQVDAGGNALSASIFRQALSQMPSKFKRNRTQLKWLAPIELEEMWRERVASRATGMGDKALNGNGNLTPFGIELLPVPLMELYPLNVKTEAFTGSGTTISLDFAPIQAGSVVVLSEADAATGQSRTPYLITTDYTVDATAGTVTHAGGGSNIGATENVRITYRAFPQMLLTTLNNIIIGIGRDIRMEQDRDIYRGVDQFATTVKVDVKFEELTAVVKVSNISDTQ